MNRNKKRVIVAACVLGSAVTGLVLLVQSSSKDLILNYPDPNGSRRSDGLPNRIEIGMDKTQEDAEAAAANMPKATMITKDGFRPSNITLKMGKDITFYNKTGNRSQLYTKSDRVEITRQIQAPDESRKIVFPNSGRIEIIDVFNSGIKLTVNVQR